MATGVGGPAGAMLASFGTDALIQKATTGKVNYVQAGIAGLAGGAGFVASKGLAIGSKVLIAQKTVKGLSMGGKVALKGGIGFGEGYSTEVAKGASPFSVQAFGGGTASAFTGGLGARGDEVAAVTKKSISDRIMAEAEGRGKIMTKVITADAKISSNMASFGIKEGHAVAGGTGGELLKQVTDDKPGIDAGKVGGKAIGAAVSKPLPTGWSSPAGKGIGAMISGPEPTSASGGDYAASGGGGW